jgi:hypothetical protein
VARVNSISEDQAEHYLFELMSECDVAIDCNRLFRRAAEVWLRHDYPRDSDLIPGAQAIEAEREMKAAVEGLLSASGRVSLSLFPPSNPANSRLHVARCSARCSG